MPDKLTTTEFLIVQELAKRPGIIKERAQLMDIAYREDTDIEDRTIDSHVKRIRKKFKTKLLLQIHDELIFEIPNNELDRIKKLIKTEMTSVKSSEHHTFSIPILVDVIIGDNWGMLH